MPSASDVTVAGRAGGAGAGADTSAGGAAIAMTGTDGAEVGTMATTGRGTGAGTVTGAGWTLVCNVWLSGGAGLEGLGGGGGGARLTAMRLSSRVLTTR